MTQSWMLPTMAATAALSIVLTTGIASAQALSDEPAKKAVPKAATAPKETLPRGATRVTVSPVESSRPIEPTEFFVMIADAEPDATKEKLQERIELGARFLLRDLGKLGPNQTFPLERIVPEPLTREQYDILTRFISTGKLPTDKEDPDVMVRDPNGSWRVNLGGDYALEKLVVHYQDGKSVPIPNDGSEVRLTPSAPPVKIKEITVGRYRIDGITPNDLKVQPVRFEIYATDDGKEQPVRIVEIPRENTYWQITVKDFPGDQKQLFDALATHPKLANKIMRKQISERRFALGSLLRKPVFSEVTIIDNVVTFTFYKPPSTDATRVWMRFPLDADEVGEEHKKYQAFSEIRLPQEIMKSSPVQASEGVKLAPPPAPPRWYEIPLDKEGVFKKAFELDQIDAWKARADKPLHYLIVWQKDEGQDAQAFIITDSVTNESSPVKAEEAKNWPVQIKRAKLPE